MYSAVQYEGGGGGGGGGGEEERREEEGHNVILEKLTGRILTGPHTSKHSHNLHTYVGEPYLCC